MWQRTARVESASHKHKKLQLYNLVSSAQCHSLKKLNIRLIFSLVFTLVLQVELKLTSVGERTTTGPTKME